MTVAPLFRDRRLFVVATRSAAARYKAPLRGRGRFPASLRGWNPMVPAHSAPDARRRRLTVRAWRRGLRELDLLFGFYADAHVASLGETDLAEFERLLDQEDAPMLAWMMGFEPVPTEVDTPLFRAIRDARAPGKA